MFSKNSKEYISNGHYLIDGIEYYSIWTFKRKCGIERNSNDSNSVDSINLLSKNVKCKQSIPDIGNFDEVKLFSKVDLFNYYKSEIKFWNA